MFSRAETDRFAVIVKLFELLKLGEIERFRAMLTPDDVNTPYISVIYDYYYDPCGVYNHLRRVQRVEQYLIHQAIELGDPDVLILILQRGGNLLLRERVDEEKWERHSYKSTGSTQQYPTVLEVLSNSSNVFLKQAVFDYISGNERLYQQADYFKFISDKLQYAVLKNFNAKCLQIDLGRPLPAGFNSPTELKRFLIESGVDVAGIFFTKEDYLQYLTTPGQLITESFLRHALKVSEFSAEELQHIYGTVTDRELKSAVLDHSPEADPAFLAALLALDGIATAPAPALAPSSAPPPVAQPRARTRNPNFTPQVESHLKSRITVLSDKVEFLSGKKRSPKEETELKQAKASLKDRKDELRANTAFEDDEPREKSRRFEGGY